MVWAAAGPCPAEGGIPPVAADATRYGGLLVQDDNWLRDGFGLTRREG
jgi:hypothetical protein